LPYPARVQLEKLVITGIKAENGGLWLAVPEEKCAVRVELSTGKVAAKIVCPHSVWDACPGEEGTWLMTSGGPLGRQVVLWSSAEQAFRLKWNCPDGAGAGIALFDGRLWLPHRHNRKLFCLDPRSGKTIWVTRTERELFSPSAHRNELWFVEADPGPLGHWSGEPSRYFFSRYDPVRERILERIAVPLEPSCMGAGAERFWYAREGEPGLASAEKNLSEFRPIPLR
jgi:hypothetical protein